MLPECRIPAPVTALYVFAIVNLTALLNFKLVEANVLVKDDRINETVVILQDAPARFGPELTDDGVSGHLAYANPIEACTNIARPPKTNSTMGWIVLIKRHGCDFDKKVINAEKSGYIAAIVHNVDSDELVPMGKGQSRTKINISSVFIGATDADKLRPYLNITTYHVEVDSEDEPPINPTLYLLPFIIVVGVCFVLMTAFLIVKWVRDIRKKRRSRLSLAHLKKIPVKKFKKGDEYDVCAICLDEYEDGDKLRVLPCSHAYHQKCIDPWLTKNKRTCPICKRKVIPGDDNDSESDSDEEDTENENTPLLQAATGGATESSNTTRPSAFQRSGLPDVMRRALIRNIPDEDTSSEDSVDMSPSQHQSSVEVHESSGNYGHHGASRGYGTMATVAMTNEINNGDISTGGDDDSDEGSDRSDEGRLQRENQSQGHNGNGETSEERELGPVAGVTNPAFTVVEDHFGKELGAAAPVPEQIDTASSASESDCDESDDDAEVQVVNYAPPPEASKRGAEIV